MRVWQSAHAARGCPLDLPPLHPSVYYRARAAGVAGPACWPALGPRLTQQATLGHLEYEPKQSFLVSRSQETSQYSCFLFHGETCEMQHFIFYFEWDFLVDPWPLVLILLLWRLLNLCRVDLPSPGVHITFQGPLSAHLVHLAWHHEWK